MDHQGKPPPSAAASFLFSPIPRDPTQRLFMDSSRKAPGQRTGSFLEAEATDAPRSAETSLAKRPRLEAESAAIVKSERLSTELESLRLQLDHRSETHQSQLKERDQQVNQLRRQLQYALAEEEHTRAELKSLTTEYANEKLALQKKVVELESKLQFVEDSFSEWREKADDTINELQANARKSKLTIQLLNDEIEALKQRAAPPPPSEYSALESKIKLLETSLRDKDLEIQAADERIQNASMTLESSRDVRALNERIAELESSERRLKHELVELIASSRSSAVHDEKLMQMRQKLQASEQRYALAQQEISQLNIRQQSLRELEQFFEPIAKQDGMTRALTEAPSRAIIGAYERLQSTTSKLQEEKRRVEQQLAQARKSIDDADNAVLETTRLDGTEFNPEKTKVIHMAINPTSELLGASQQSREIELLRAEIARLRSQLAGGTPSTNLPSTPAPAVTPSATLTTTTSYETVEGQKLLNQRLKQIFQNQIKQYREAVFQLTGYKVEMRKSNGVEILTLRSIYADHEDDHLVVRMEADGSLELLESDFSHHIDSRVFAYLTTCRSFPAFLSTLTLHLFEKQTFQGT